MGAGATASLVHRMMQCVAVSLHIVIYYNSSICPRVAMPTCLHSIKPAAAVTRHSQAISGRTVHSCLNHS